MDLIESGVRIALHTAGCRDVDAAVQLGAASSVKLTDAGDVDAASVAAAVGTFRAAKPYLFEAAKEPAVAPATAKSALDMTDEEYKAARRRSGQSPTYSMSSAPDAIGELERTRGESNSAATWGGRRVASRSKDQQHDSSTRSHAAKFLESRGNVLSSAALAPGRGS